MSDWALVVTFFLANAVIAWTLFMYLPVLAWMSRRRQPAEPPQRSREVSSVSVVVACYNEEARILDKLDNLRALESIDGSLEICFVDGGSTDRTVELLERATAHDRHVQVLRSPVGGKIPQLNFALGHLAGDIVLNTDADALLTPNTIRRLLEEFRRDASVGVVGAYTVPGPTTHSVDRLYWDAQNRARVLETQAVSASIVVAPCYAFRRRLVRAFPEDVVADDVYVSFLAHSQGKRVIYCTDIQAVELRNPTTLTELARHKIRKANAFLRESFRILPSVSRMDRPRQLVVLMRLCQQTLLPPALAIWSLAAVALFFVESAEVALAAVSVSVLFQLGWATASHRALRRVDAPLSESSPALAVLGAHALTLIVLLCCLVTFPLFRQTSVYRRVTEASTGTLRRDVG